MSVDELKTHLEERRTESRRRLQKMRQICGNIRTMVKESRALHDIQQIKDQIKHEFAEFTLPEGTVEDLDAHMEADKDLGAKEAFKETEVATHVV